MRPSGNPVIRGLNAQAQTAWFYKQIIHLADGAEPELDLTGRAAISQHFRREYGLAKARKETVRQTPPRSM